MKHHNELKEMLCEELDKVAMKGDIKAGELEYIHMLTDTIKNLGKIEMLEESEYSRMDDEYSQRRGYSRDGDWEARGNYGGHHYSRDGESSYNEGGNSYRGRKRDSMGRYSRDDGKEHITHQLRDMMNHADSEHDRETLRKCISMIENA